MDINSNQIIKWNRMRWAEHVVDNRNAYRVVVEKPGGRRLLGTIRFRCECDCKLDLKLVG
jgi:hypothetical protein